MEFGLAARSGLQAERLGCQPNASLEGIGHDSGLLGYLGQFAELVEIRTSSVYLHDDGVEAGWRSSEITTHDRLAFGQVKAAGPNCRDQVCS